MSGPIVIFGATGGVGTALARRLHARGQHVFLSARDDAALQTLAEPLNARYAAGDVLNTDDIARIIAAATDTAPDTAPGGQSLAGLAFCVGSIDLKPLRRATADDFMHAFHLNALSAAMAVQQAAPALKKGKGAVVLFSTIAVAHGFTNHTIVSAAKGAVEGLGRALAADLAPDVRVNVIAPSLLDTTLAQPITQSQAMADGIAKLHPIPRLGDPEDAAALAAFVLSEEAGWITGQVLRADGGRSHVRTKG